MNLIRLMPGCLLLLLLVPRLLAQDATGESPERPFIDTLDVNVVNIEVFVTDKQGNPVTGLTRGDFKVYEDGRPIEITYNDAAAADNHAL